MAELRIDRLLWFLRFSKSRSLAQKWVAEGHFRRNGTRVEKLDQPVLVGDILTLPMRHRVAVIEILALPTRRGPAEEARSCYRELDAGKTMDIAGGTNQRSEGQSHS